MRNLGRILLIIAAPLIVALLTFLFLNSAFRKPPQPGNTPGVIVEIAPGKTFSDISRELKEKGLIKYRWTLELLARFKKADTKISSGEYEISPSMTPSEILRKLMSGEIIKRQVTLKEGVTIWEIGKLLEDQGIITAEEFNKTLTDPGLLAKAGIGASSFEGYLFPDTYQFSRPITAEHIIWRMLEEGEKHWSPEFTDKADQLKMSRHEILTLASIIEKESGNVDEQPLIASVFHNRLGQGMKLQSDPTVIYGLTNFDGNLTKDDLQNPHPYNTYVHFGLPPSPICNPGDNAIRSALFPKQSTFLFFVADGKGNHVFSTTLQEHNEAVNMYQRGGGGSAKSAAGNSGSGTSAAPR